MAKGNFLNIPYNFFLMFKWTKSVMTRYIKIFKAEQSRGAEAVAQW